MHFINKRPNDSAKNWRVCEYLLGSAAAGEEVAVVVAVEGDVEDVGVAVEGLLGAVAMVNVLRRQVTLPSERRSEGLWFMVQTRGTNTEFGQHLTLFLQVYKHVACT